MMERLDVSPGRSPRVSVVMPAFNEGSRIGQAIDSILGQSFSDFELIVEALPETLHGDDASIDDTVSVVQSFSDPRLRLVRRRENSLSGVTPRNDGMAVSAGEYIAVADADDISLTNRLRHQVDFLDAHPDTDLLGGGFTPIDHRGKRLGRDEERPNFSDRSQAREWALKGRNPLLHGTLMFRSPVLGSLRGYNDYASSGDSDFLIRATRRYRISNLKHPLILRRVHSESVTRRWGKVLRGHYHAVFRERERIWEAHVGNTGKGEGNPHVDVVRRGSAEDPVVSVVMPVFNNRAYVVQAVESILDQSFGNIELIVVDDGSTDDSASRLSAIEDSRLTLIMRSECSCSGNLARNDGFDLVRGEFIALADADDIYPLKRIEKQLAFFDERPDADILGGGMIPIDSVGSRCGPSVEKPVYRNPLDSRRAMVRGRNMIFNPTSIFRSAVIDRIGGFNDYPSSADHEFYLRASRRFRLYNSAEPAVYHRKHLQSVSSRYGKRLRKHLHAIFMFREHTWVQQEIRRLSVQQT